MSLALPLPPGTLIANDFRVERELARGGMGALYVVTQLATGHERVLKVMHSRLVNDPRSRERFLQEARASARIESDHVVQVIAAGFDDHGIPWIVMEFLRGEDLATALARRGAFTSAEALEFFRQLGHALGAAHAAGLVHRDLKPENIFLAHPRREGVPFTVKLLDFGIAKVLAESGDARNTGALGTPLWMAPEQAEHSLLTPASDVWAMGLVAFGVLTGRCYWHAGNLPEAPIERVLREVFLDPLEAPSVRAGAFGKSLPPGFDGWFGRCVVRDPTLRFANATEAVAALVPVLLGPAATAEVPVSPWGTNTPRPGPFTRETPVPPIPPTEFAAPPAIPLAVPPPNLDRTVNWDGATPYPGPHGSQPGLPYAATPLPSPPFSGYPTPVPSQPGYPPQPTGVPLQPTGVPLQPTGVRLQQTESSGTWVLAGGLAFLALALIGGGIILLFFRPPKTIADAGRPVRVLSPDAGRPAPPPPRPTRVAVRGGTVGVGFEHSCARTPGGTVRCWGWNLFGQLGDPSRVSHATPFAVPGIANVIEVAAGYAHTCVRLADGRVQCWGLNANGQLGDGTATNRALPAEVLGLRGVLQLALGEGHTCALLEDHTVRCWGANGSGQLGDHSDTDRALPVPVQGLANVVEVAAGNEHSCARQSDGTVWCWGASSFGEVGDGWTRHHYVPARVSGLTGATALGLGPYRSCAVITDGSVRCWGRNDSGQLGDGTHTSRSTFVTIPGLGDVSDVVLAAFHTCAITNDGTLRCWGDNESGRLGDGSQVARTPAVPAEPLRTVREVHMLEAHACARLENGSVACWGGNASGQVGDGSNAVHLAPTVVRLAE